MFNSYKGIFALFTMVVMDSPRVQQMIIMALQGDGSVLPNHPSTCPRPVKLFWMGNNILLSYRSCVCYLSESSQIGIWTDAMKNLGGTLGS